MNDFDRRAVRRALPADLPARARRRRLVHVLAPRRLRARRLRCADHVGFCREPTEAAASVPSFSGLCLIQILR